MLNTINHLISSLRQQIRQMKTLELIKLLSGVNANHGAINCAHVALKVDELLSNGPEENLSPVPTTDAQLYTKIFRLKNGSVLYSSTSDLRIIERHKGVSINYHLTEDNEMILEVDLGYLKEEEILLKRATYKTIIAQIRMLPRRQSDGSAQGFIFYTPEKFTEGNTVQIGHMANFLVDRFDEVYFLDGQSKDPALWVLPFPPQHGYRPELFYINSLPTENMMFNLPQFILPSLQIRSDYSDSISAMLENYAQTLQILEGARDKILNNLKYQLIQEIKLIQSYYNVSFLDFMLVLLHSPKVNQKILSAIQNNIGEWYLSACDFPIEFRKQRAFFHFRTGAALGNTDALVNLGMCYYENIGVPILEKEHRLEKAFQYLKEASKRGKLLPEKMLLKLHLEEEAKRLKEVRQIEALLNSNSNQLLGDINTVVSNDFRVNTTIRPSLTAFSGQLSNIHSSSVDPFSNVSYSLPNPDIRLSDVVQPEFQSPNPVNFSSPSVNSLLSLPSTEPLNNSHGFANATTSMLPLYAMKIQEVSPLVHNPTFTEQTIRMSCKRKYSTI